MSHAVVGIALGSLTRFPGRRPLFWTLAVVLPVVPDHHAVAPALAAIAVGTALRSVRSRR